MALAFSTVGAVVKYCVESTAGSRPITGYTAIPDVNEAPEVDLSVDALDASSIGDTVTKYIAGRKDPGSDKTFTLNHTEAAITAWGSLVTAAASAKSAGKKVWFEYTYDGATKSFFWAGDPQALGNNGIQQNQADTIPAHCIPNDVEGWAAKST